MGFSVVAGAIIGGLMQNKGQSKAAKATSEQQEKALEFQEKQIQRGLKELDKGFTFAREGRLAQMEKARRQSEAAIAARGYDPASTMALGAKRAIAADTSAQLSQLYQNIAQSRAALYAGQSYPMITQQAPQGNMGADLASLAMLLAGSRSSSPSFSPMELSMGGTGMSSVGSAMSGAGLGMFGFPMQMIGSGMTDLSTDVSVGD